MKKSLVFILALLCNLHVKAQLVFTGYDLNTFVSENSKPHHFFGYKGKLLFSAYTDTTGQELWISDGTIAGTHMLIDLSPGYSSNPGSPGPNGSFPFNFIEYGGKAYFSLTFSQSGGAFYETDGTASGTKKVKNVYPRVGPSYDGLPKPTLYKGKMYFCGRDTSVIGLELWVSDGTTAGTVMLKDIWSGVGESEPKMLTVCNGKLLFTADDGTHGRELWVTDGTTAGTVMLKDIAPGSTPGDPGNLFVFGTNIYFSAFTPATGYELWKSDGTTAGTVMVKDIWPGNGSGYCNGTCAPWGGYAQFEMTSYNGKMYLAACDGTNGIELWQSDGTTAGTIMLKDIYPGSNVSGINNGEPKNFKEFNGKLFFQARDSANGRELWNTDGTASGTVLFKKIYSGFSGSEPENLTVYRNKMYFVTRYSRRELHQTDGTSAGTVVVKPSTATSTYIPTLLPYAQPYELYVNPMDSAMYFAAEYKSTGVTGVELWSLFDTTNYTCDSPAHISIDTINGFSATISWDTVAGVSQYEYYVGIHPSTPTLGTLTTNHSIRIIGLASGTTYDFCVRSRCTYGNSAWICDTFTTLTHGGVPTINNNDNIRIYPNPSKGIFTVETNSDFNKGTVAIYDMVGRNIYQSQITNSKFQITLNNQPKGIYTVKVLTDNAIHTQRITIE